MGRSTTPTRYDTPKSHHEYYDDQHGDGSPDISPFIRRFAAVAAILKPGAVLVPFITFSTIHSVVVVYVCAAKGARGDAFKV